MTAISAFAQAPSPSLPASQVTASAPEAKAPKAHKFFPYTVRAGDTLSSIAQYFGMTTADLAHINKLQEDDELEEGESLKIPNPFEASQRSLEAEVQQLSDENRANTQKIEQAQTQVATLTNSNSDLTAQNASLKESVKVLPWWRGTSLAAGAAALLMLGVTTLTLVRMVDAPPPLPRAQRSFDVAQPPRCEVQRDHREGGVADAATLRTSPPGGRARASHRWHEDSR